MSITTWEIISPSRIADAVPWMILPVPGQVLDFVVIHVTVLTQLEMNSERCSGRCQSSITFTFRSSSSES